MIQFLAVILALALCGYYAAKAVELTCPHLTWRQCWTAVAYVAFAVASLRAAWTLGER